VLDGQFVAVVLRGGMKRWDHSGPVKWTEDKIMAGRWTTLEVEQDLQRKIKVGYRGKKLYNSKTTD